MTPTHHTQKIEGECSINHSDYFGKCPGCHKKLPDIVSYVTESARLTARIKVLEEALKPFAGLPELSEAETAVPNESPVTIRCQLGDIRRAYAAITPHTEEGTR